VPIPLLTVVNYFSQDVARYFSLTSRGAANVGLVR